MYVLTQVLFEKEQAMLTLDVLFLLPHDQGDADLIEYICN